MADAKRNSRTRWVNASNVLVVKRIITRLYESLIAGSNPARNTVIEAKVDDALRCERRYSRFKSGRSPLKECEVKVFNS